MTTNSRHPVSDSESYTLVDETNAMHGSISFVSFGPVNKFGYRGCGVFSCEPSAMHANIAAIKRGNERVFRKRTGEEM